MLKEPKPKSGTNPRLRPGVTEVPPKTFTRPGTRAYSSFQGQALGPDIRTGPRQLPRQHLKYKD
jgi:hypothetical protein